MSLSPGNSEVIATRVSAFDTIWFNTEGYSKRTISDHSGKYYAIYSKARCVLQIWDIETGEMVRHIRDSWFPKIVNVTSVLVAAKQGPNGPQQVVVTGNDGARNHRPSWTQAPGERNYVAEFKVFPVEAGTSEWTGRIAEPEGQPGRCWLPAFDALLLATPPKVPRWPAGITSLDAPDAPGYLSEEVGLTLWYWNSEAGNVDSLYHRITPEHFPISAPDVPLAVERRFRMAFEGNPWFSTFTIGYRSGLSIAISCTNRYEDCVEPRQKLRHLCVRSFYPSPTPGVMDLEWESFLKSSTDREKARSLYPAKTDVVHFDTFPHVLTDPDELATAFLEKTPEGVFLVLVLWDDRFHGELPLGGEVLN